MRKGLYGILDKYKIYNPEFKPPDCAFEFSSSSLNKNPKFIFLKEKLIEYYTKKELRGMVSLLSYSTEQWKACLFKNLHALLTEVAYTQESNLQEEMLDKIQNWYFTKLRLPNIAAAPSLLDSSPLEKSNSPSPSSSHSSVIHYSAPKHNKSNSVMLESKKQYINNSERFDNLTLGAVDARHKLLQYFRNDYGSSEAVPDENIIKSQGPLIKRDTKRLPSLRHAVKFSTSQKIEEVREAHIKLRSLSECNEDFEMGKGTHQAMLKRKLPSGGEYLMKLPPKVVNRTKK